MPSSLVQACSLASACGTRGACKAPVQSSTRARITHLPTYPLTHLPTCPPTCSLRRAKPVQYTSPSKSTPRNLSVSEALTSWLQGDTECELTLSGEWLAEGVYQLAYACSRAGSYDLHLWYTDPWDSELSGGTAELGASPHALDVVPNVADSRGSSVHLDGWLLNCEPLLLNNGQPGQRGVRGLPAGTELTAAIRVADRLGNPTTPQEGDLEVLLVRPGAAGHRGGSHHGGEPIYAAAQHPVGDHAVGEVLRRCGWYTLNVTVRGEAVHGSPLGPILVHALPPEAEHSTLELPQHAVAGQPAAPLIHCRDRFGNFLPRAQLDRAVDSGLISVRIDGGPARPAYTLEARDDGAVEMSVHAHVSGDYRLHVWVGGRLLCEAPQAPQESSILHVEPPPFTRPGAVDDEGSKAAPTARSPMGVSPSSGSRVQGTGSREQGAGGVRPCSAHSHAGHTPRDGSSHRSPPHSPFSSPRLPLSPPPPPSSSRVHSPGRVHSSNAPGRGYMPTSPRNSTSPRTWHGLRRADSAAPKLAIASSSSSRSGSSRRRSQAHASSLTSLASPRTPPRVAFGRMRLEAYRELSAGAVGSGGSLEKALDGAGLQEAYVAAATPATSQQQHIDVS